MTIKNWPGSALTLSRTWDGQTTLFSDPQIQDNMIYIGIVSSLVAFGNIMVAKTWNWFKITAGGVFLLWSVDLQDLGLSRHDLGRLGVAPALAALALSLRRIHSSVAAWLTSTKHFKDLSNQTRASNDFELTHCLNCPPPHLICQKYRICWQNVLKDSAFLLRASPSTTWTHHHVATSSLSIALPNPLRYYYKKFARKTSQTLLFLLDSCGQGLINWGYAATT